MISNSETASDPNSGQLPCATDLSTTPSQEQQVQNSKWYRLRHEGTAIVNYLLDSEVHTFAFSVAANAILSFIPFVVLLNALAKSVFSSQAMSGVIVDMIYYFFPADQDFIVRNLAVDPSRHGVQVFSVVLILIACTGIFLPLEVALNQAWGVTKSRNYIMNQIVAFGLAIWMVVLGMAAILLSAGQRQILAFLFFHHTDNFVFRGISDIWMAVCAAVACILFFFSVYWLLPNCKVPARPVLRASIIVGLIWLAAKYAFIALLPHFNLKELYGPFHVSVGLLFWAYTSGLILFAGAQYSVKQLGTSVKK